MFRSPWIVCALLAALALSGCDPNPDGPTAPSAPSPAASPPNSRPFKKKSTTPLREVGPPADTAS